jgi:hypothetical protein
LAQVQALIAGMQQHFPSGSFTLGSVAFTTASLVQELQSLASAMLKANTADASAKDARATLQTTAATVDPVIRNLQRFLVSAFTTTQTLADFGMQTPRVRKPLSTEARATATAKLRATRKARGTTSKKQKLAVKGDVTGVIVTPVTQPAVASPPQPTSNPSSALVGPVMPASAPPK